MIDQKIFRAYDIRGTYPNQINEEVAYSVARAYAKKINPKTVVVGRDIREASAKMHEKVIAGLIESGVNVKDAGQMTNPMIGFAVFNYGYNGGIILSASHNPIGYGGMKMTKKDAVTVPGDDAELKKLTIAGEGIEGAVKGEVENVSIYNDYITFIKKIIDIKKLKKQKILLDPMYGSVGLIIDKVLEGLPIERVDFRIKPDSTFGGLAEPNPLNSKMRQATEELAQKEKPDFSAIWDGDGDRVFFLDENGKFIDAPYITAVIIETIARMHPNSSVVADLRIIWPQQKAAEKSNLKLMTSKGGYRFIKEVMSQNKAVFGAEMTAHYFFEETHYMDNGIIPFLLIWQAISESGKKLSQLVAPYKENHFMIEEIKFNLEDPSAVIEKLRKEFSDGKANDIDGLTIEYSDWRFNFRASNTEPVAKLNLEAKNEKLMEEMTEKITQIIKGE